MATLELCDLCGGKVQREFVNLTMRGRMQMYDGKPPEPPAGFKYAENETENCKTFIKTWDAYGKVISEIRMMPKPPKWRQIQVKYDLCEDCSSKMMMLLEQLRSKYHLEQKEIQMLDAPRQNPWFMLGFDEDWKADANGD